MIINAVQKYYEQIIRPMQKRLKITVTINQEAREKYRDRYSDDEINTIMCHMSEKNFDVDYRSGDISLDDFYKGLFDFKVEELSDEYDGGEISIISERFDSYLCRR